MLTFYSLVISDLSGTCDVLVFRVSAVKICKNYSVSPHVTTSNSPWDLLKFLDKFHSYSCQTVMSDTLQKTKLFVKCLTLLSGMNKNGICPKILVNPKASY